MMVSPMPYVRLLGSRVITTGGDVVFMAVVLG